MKANTNFRTKYELNFPLLCDTDRKIHEKYGVMKEKKMYGKVVMGVDRSTFLIGPDGKLRAIWRGVKVPGHVDAVFEGLKAAQAG